MPLLHGIVLLAGVGCAVALGASFLSARAFGARRLFAPPLGDTEAGVRYAFTKGMAPQAKESVRRNPASYLAGMLYHSGVFAAFGLLGMHLLGLHGAKALAILAVGGAMGGLALQVKRAFKAHLRGLSNLDDYLSNGLATAFAGLAAASVWLPSLASLWLVETILLLVYMPLGKIRHCIFFFSTRYHSGAFFGRRGVFPPGPDRA